MSLGRAGVALCRDLIVHTEISLFFSFSTVLIYLQNYAVMK